MLSQNTVIDNGKSIEALFAYNASATSRIADLRSPFENEHLVSKLGKPVGDVTPDRASTHCYCIIQFGTCSQIIISLIRYSVNASTKES
jgi:hypothetical protein